MMNRIRNMDFYRKIPKDLTEGTFSGGGLSVAGAVFMVILFVLELNNYMTINNMSRIVMDDSNDDMLQINFNITLPKLPCEYASVDVSDVLGTHRVNLTKNIRKWRVGENGEQRLEEVHADPVEIGTFILLETNCVLMFDHHSISKDGGSRACSQGRRTNIDPAG